MKYVLLTALLISIVSSSIINVQDNDTLRDQHQ